MTGVPSLQATAREAHLPLGEAVCLTPTPCPLFQTVACTWGWDSPFNLSQWAGDLPSLALAVHSHCKGACSASGYRPLLAP